MVVKSPGQGVFLERVRQGETWAVVTVVRLAGCHPVSDG